MFLRSTKKLSEQATTEVLKELESPNSTVKMKAQQAQVKAMSAQIQKKAAERTNDTTKSISADA